MKNNARFFQNIECEYYPCHKGITDINCLFCYCPMYRIKCPGNPEYIEVNGMKIKSCSNCTFPHKRENYDKIMRVLSENKYLP